MVASERQKGSMFVSAGELFLEATAVLMAEVVKLVTCLYLVYRDENRDARQWTNALYNTVVVNKMDTLKVCIPSAIYLIQVST